MRRTLRQFAAVKPTRFLEPNTPTGLTGLQTHPAPRSTLLYLYNSTLEKLSQFPESSLYRQSTEALVKHRLNIVENTVPAGYEEWRAKTAQIVQEHPDVFTTPAGKVPYAKGKYGEVERNGVKFVSIRPEEENIDYSREEWDGETFSPALEGVRTTEERKDQKLLTVPRPDEDEKHVELDPEPPLNADQIGEIENKIGHGLIEEVIQVAEGELRLADVMLEAKVWEDLEEKPVEGQWTYFMRDTATPTTQQPPQK